MPETLTIEPLPALRDNYIWALSQGADAAVVDPGEAAPVERWLKARGHRLTAILVTHHHPDHTGGIPALKKRHRVRVYAPAGEPVRGCDQPLREHDVITPLVNGPALRILDIPGHTRGHIAFHGENLLFCGDTLFSGGCGRVFEGTPGQLFGSLAKLASLPAKTGVYAGHEYTLANLEFARQVLPDDVWLEEALANALETRDNGKVTLPSSIADERRINVFLRSEGKSVKNAAERHCGETLNTPLEVFTVLRDWKDHFRGV